MAQKFLNGIDVSSTTVVNGSNLDSGSTVLDVQGSQGQLFSVTNSLTGDLFSVSDISGIPILNVNSSGIVTIDGDIQIAEKLIHSGDTNTYIQFSDTNDKIVLATNGSDALTLDAANAATFAGTITTGGDLTIGGTGGIFIPEYIYHTGDGNTYFGFPSNDIFRVATGGTARFEITTSTVNVSNASFKALGALATGPGIAETGVGLGQASNYAHAQFSGSAGGYIDFAEPNVDWSGRIIYTHSSDSMVFYTAATAVLTLDSSNNATFANNITMAANATVDGVDISALPTTFAPTNAEQNVQSDWNATSGDAQILNKLNREFVANEWGDDRFKRTVTGTNTAGSSTGDTWVKLSSVDITSAYHKVKIKFTIGSSDDNARGREQIDVLYENGNSAQENHQLRWYAGDSLPTLFKAIKSIRSASSGTSNTYDVYVQMSADWQDSFTVYAEWWRYGGSIEYPTTEGSSTTPTAGSDDKSLTSRQRWVDADKLDGQDGSYYAPAATTLAGYGITDSLVIGTTSTTAMAGNTTIPTDHGAHNGLYLPIGGGILTGDLKINTKIGFQRDGTNYSNYIKSSQYGSEGYDDSGTPPDDRYWLEYGAKGGHHFVVNTDGGTGSAENAYDDFTIWQGEVDGDRLFEVTNVGNTSITGGVKVLGSIESRKNIVSNANYNIAQISSTRTTDDYGGLNKTYAKLDIQTPGPNTDGTSSAHGLAHLSIKLADNAGNSDLVQKALLRHDSELILGGFYPQTSETELAGLTIRSRYAGSNRNFLRFQTDHSSATTEWTMAKIYAGDGGNFNGKMFFQVATGSNGATAYDSGHDAQLETAMFIDDTKEVTFNSNIKLAGANPYIIGGGTGAMRFKHTSGQTMYIRPDETGALSFFEGANSQSIYFMTQSPTVNNTTNESAKLVFQTRSKQSDGQDNSKSAIIKHLTHNVGSNHTTLDFAGSTKAKFNMPLEAAGGLYFTGDTHMGFIPHPRGAQYRSDSSSDTGYIMIKLPTDIGNSPDDMVSFYVDIYDYTTNEMISVFVGGYTYRITSTSVYWYNCTAIINAKHTGKDFNVRFGHDGTNYYVAIGETDSVWSHPSIVVRDVQCSYRSNVEHYIDGWAISTETTTLTGVDETQTGNFPQAKHAITATTATTASAVPYSGLTGTVPTWNQNTTGSAGSVAWGNITSKPYIETNGTTSATATTAIASVAHATYTAAFFDFVIKNGTNVRAGTVYACHDGTNVEFTETSTVDLGDTSDVTLNVVISTSYLQLQATTTSSTWTIKSLIRAI